MLHPEDPVTFLKFMRIITMALLPKGITTIKLKIGGAIVYEDRQVILSFENGEEFYYSPPGEFVDCLPVHHRYKVLSQSEEKTKDGIQRTYLVKHLKGV